MLCLEEINQIVEGQLNGDNVAVRSVAIDTRTLSPGALYIAIKGENFDGNDFIAQAQQAGAVAAIVDKQIASDLPHIQVFDTRKALADLANSWRQKFPVKMVGITGSNGKTTVKEMTAAILAEQAPVLYTQGNLNNEIGVPLTLLRLTEEHRFAVIEMGANHPGEIAYTCACAQPEVTLINNIGPAHIEGFGGIDGVAKAKGEIITGLPEQGVAVLNRDDRYYGYFQELSGNRRQISFGLHASADIRASNIETVFFENGFANRFTLHINDTAIELTISLPGVHNVRNALAATAAATALGVDSECIKQGLEKVRAVTGRLQLLQSKYGGIVIDDTYNANPASLQAGLEVLDSCPGAHWVVLGAFGELGDNSPSLHRDMANTMKQMKVERLFATGADARYTVEQFGAGGHYFDNKATLIETLKEQLSEAQSVLIKGSRAQKMEQVAAAIVADFRV